jgi:hypothetical protein
MRGRAAHEHETRNACAMTAHGLERDLNAHGMADDDGAVDLRIIEHARSIVGEVLDGHPRWIARRWRAPVSAVMRMDTVAVV